MNNVFVLETSGKNESVDYAKVLTFSDVETANNYCDFITTGYCRNWIKAEVISLNVSYELTQPDDGF